METNTNQNDWIHNAQSNTQFQNQDKKSTFDPRNNQPRARFMFHGQTGSAPPPNCGNMSGGFNRPPGPYGPMMPPGMPPPWMMPPGRFRSPQSWPQSSAPRGAFSPRFQGHRPRHRLPGHQAAPQKGKKSNFGKRDLAENNQYFCDTCDRGFKTEDKYREHVDQHEKCQAPDCKYVAAPKLVKLHYDMQHRTGLAKKVWTVESEEDLSKWIKERKRKFPTTANVEKRRQEAEQRQTRGEVLETRYFGKVRGRGRGRGRGGHRGGRYQQEERSHAQKRPHHHDDDDTSGRDNNACPVPPKDPRLDPLAYILDDKDGNDDGNEAAAAEIKPSNLPGALGSLVSSYGDASTSDEDPPDEIPVNNNNKVNTDLIVKHQQSTPNSELPRVSSATVKETSSDRTSKHRKRRRKRARANTDNIAPPRRSTTLLQKLLANEIRHERNVILQCIRHLVKTRLVLPKSKSHSENKPTAVEPTGQSSTPLQEMQGQTKPHGDIPPALESSRQSSAPSVQEMNTQTVADEEVWEEGI